MPRVAAGRPPPRGWVAAPQRAEMVLTLFFSRSGHSGDCIRMSTGAAKKRVLLEQRFAGMARNRFARGVAKADQFMPGQ